MSIQCQKAQETCDKDNWQESQNELSEQFSFDSHVLISFTPRDSDFTLRTFCHSTPITVLLATLSRLDGCVVLSDGNI